MRPSCGARARVLRSPDVLRVPATAAAVAHCAPPAIGEAVSYAGQKTCTRCGWDMAEMPPRAPPLWLSAWVVTP